MNPSSDRQLNLAPHAFESDFGLIRNLGGYELILPLYGPPSNEPWEPTLESQFRKVGVTVEVNPPNNFKPITEVHAPWFGIYWCRRKKYIEQKDEYLKTHDTKYLILQPDLSSYKWLDTLQGGITDSMGKCEPYGLLILTAFEFRATAYSGITWRTFITIPTRPCVSVSNQNSTLRSFSICVVDNLWSGRRWSFPATQLPFLSFTGRRSLSGS